MEGEPQLLLVGHCRRVAHPCRLLGVVYEDEGVVAVGVPAEGVAPVSSTGQAPVSGHGAGWGIGGLAGIVLGVDGGPLGLYLVDLVVQDGLVGGALGLVVSEYVHEGLVAVYVTSVVVLVVA